MCGFVGIAAKAPIVNRDWLTAGQNAIIHRGPDSGGEWWSDDGLVGLVHRRLSIIDLSPAGHQPMLDSSDSLTVVFNGEIYNFLELRQKLSEKGAVFSSQSDTEVIIKAYREWGAECLSHLNGMFAFAIFDANRKTIFMARDRAGEKPLFYHLANNTLHFSSELKGLLTDKALPRLIDAEALDCYMAMGWIPNGYCILKGFKKLPPGHALQFDLKTGAVNTWCYWKLPEVDAIYQESMDKVALLDELETLFKDVVRRQLLADVPVGILLSGGVDSSLITAMAAHTSRKVKTFTIRFPGHTVLDETEHARLIAGHFGTEHMELEAQVPSVDLLVRLASQYDEPIADSSMVPTFMVSELVRQHCTVALGGDGGDELFGGYGHYSRLLWLQKRFGRIPHTIRKAISWGAEKILPVGLKGRNWLQNFGVDLRHGLPLVTSYFDATARNRLMTKQVGWKTVAESIILSRIPTHPDLLQRATRMDFMNYLAEDILVKVDRASMLNSLEVRAPFLDYRLIEFAFSKVPSVLKATQKNKKILLKCLCARWLPPSFDFMRKQGFSIPLSDWLKIGHFKDFFYDLLNHPNSIFDHQTILCLLRGQARGFCNGDRLFALVMFELWRQNYKAEL